jgi:hypothetical protein
LEKLLADRKKLDALMTSKKEKVEAQAETLQSSVAVLEDRSYIETFEKVKTFILEHKIADEVLQVLGVLEDVQRPTMQTVSLTANELYKRYDRQETVLTEVIAGYQRQNGKIPRKMMEEQIDKLRKDIAKYENEIRENPDPVEQIEGISESLMRTTQSLKDLHSCLEQACQQKFSCNLSIEMSENSCFKAKNQEWYWKLDDVTVTSKNCKVEKFLNQKTQIVFFPYNGINATTGLPETGVLIAAPYVLNFRESTDIKMRSDTQTVLLKNKSYIIDASIVVGSMIIKVL